MAISINGRDVALPDDPRVSLADLLRDDLHLTGTKIGCNQGGCGACTVLLDGARVLSCLTLAVQAEGRRVTTIEGLAEADQLHPPSSRRTGFSAVTARPARSAPPRRCCANWRRGCPAMSPLTSRPRPRSAPRKSARG